MGSLGTSNVRLPSPSFTYTKTLAKSPLETMMFSAWLVPLQPGSWLMSILAGFGAVPSNFTVPLTVATVAGSIGVAAGAACCSAVLLDCSSFLLHAASTNNAQSASRVTVIHFVFSIMMSLSLEFENAVPASCRLWRGHHSPRSEQRVNRDSAGHSTANRHSLPDAIRLQLACDWLVAAQQLSPAASTPRLSVAHRQSTGKCS